MAVVIGALLMTLGPASMAVETPTFLYIGITLLILGNGFFKPNISTIVGSLYDGTELNRDGGFTIFYMGINLGAASASSEDDGVLFAQFPLLHVCVSPPRFTHRRCATTTINKPVERATGLMLAESAPSAICSLFLLH